MNTSPDWLPDLFGAIDRKDTTAFVGFLTSDARFRFGNAPVVEGQEAIAEAVEGFFGSIKATGHHLDRVWSDANSVVCQGEVTYIRHDDSELTVPFVDVFLMQGDKIADYLIYIDISELYS